ncbi:hypothetical protein RGQ13_18175 [Thalassotalea psychrophila]|uniref:Lipoprotein n=1 Tax=Thalassotalea psychrophila TaxID=3065647 RepID=A0ABY9TU04_9GAMM|nr:hypothetical protein RGQ13_18175 [Colwelliaceae bacterium SQ149]
MKYQSIVSACLVSMLYGCASTMTSGGVSVSEPSDIDIYNAKVAYCEVFTYENATYYTGNDPKKSPAIRKEEKEKSWNAWQQKRKELKSELIGKRFFISHPAAFFTFDESTQYLKFYGKGLSKGKYSTYASAVPEKVLFNNRDYLTRAYDFPLPRGAYKFGPGVGSRVTALFKNYGNANQNVHGTYVINNVVLPNYKMRTGLFSDPVPNRKMPMFGVTLHTKKWYERDDSPIVQKEGTFYLDTTKFNFLDSFGEYPDLSTPYINISYVFEFKGCSGNRVTGDIKEVVLTTRKSKKELYRVFYK